MELVTKSGKTIVLKPKVALQDGEVIDSMFMSKKALLGLLRRADRGRAQDRRDVLAARQGDHDEGLAPDRVRPRREGLLQGRLRQARASCSTSWASTSTTAWSDLYSKIEALPAVQARGRDHRATLHACHEHRPELAMVDSAKGISNLHSPNDVIVDASMPAMIRIGGKMYGRRRPHQGHQGRDPGIDLRPDLPGNDQLLQDPRRTSIRSRWARCPTSA